MLHQFDATCDAWMEQERELGDTKTLMSFIVTASQVLVDRSIYQAVLGEATLQGSCTMDTVDTAGQGSMMQYLARAALAAMVDGTPTYAEWGGMCPWPAIICVGRLITCWEGEWPKAMHDGTCGNCGCVRGVDREQQRSLHQRDAPRQEEGQEGRATRQQLYSGVQVGGATPEAGNPFPGDNYAEAAFRGLGGDALQAGHQPHAGGVQVTH